MPLFNKLLDKLLGRTPAEPDDDSWMTEEQRNAKLAWWESRWMDRIVSVFALLLWTLASLAALALLGLLGWALWQAQVPPPSGPVTPDVTRGASFLMIGIVLGVPLALFVLYFLLRFLYNFVSGSFRDGMHRTFRPIAGPFVCLLFLALVGFFHRPVYGAIEGVYFKIMQTHNLARTSMFKTQAAPPAATPSTAP